MPSLTFTKDQKRKIVCEQIMLQLPIKEVYNRYGVKKATFYYWKNSFFPTTTAERFSEKIESDFFDTRVILHGINKEYFLTDCKKREWCSGRMIKNIVDLYYSIPANRPDGSPKEMSELKKMLTDIVKFK